MTTMRCQMCGGTISYDSFKDCYICDFCDTPVAKNQIKDPAIVEKKERANSRFLAKDFAAASNLYQEIVTLVNDDAESYWMLVLCTYGIEYVDDPLTKKKIPTCHRTSYIPISENEDYMNAIKYADMLTKVSYMDAAKRIDAIQRGILEVAAQEQPYDIFICYKETEDGSDSRTRESDIAKDLYYKLHAEGYRTFYAPISLQKNAGMEYEPFIFSALNSAKLMFVIGFSAEHYNAVWVKNEWSRFLMRKTQNPRLLLVSCYNSFLMRAEDLPSELSKTQARDLANASTNDLVADVKKWLPKKTQETKTNVDVSNLMGENAASMLKRGFIYLEDGEFSEAADRFNKSLDLNPELSKCYWGLLLTKYRCRNSDELARLGKPFEELSEYRKAARFASEAEKAEYQSVIEKINNKIETTLSALKQRREDEVAATGVLDELNDSTENIALLEKEYNQLLASLSDVEEKLQQCVAECKGVTEPYSQRIAVITNKVKGWIEKLKSVKAVTDEEKANTTAQIAADKKEIESKILVEYNEAKAQNPCFVMMYDLLNQQKKLIDSLEEVSKKLDHQTEKLAQYYETMNQIEQKYAPSWSQVPAGDYSLASQLLA